MEILITNDDGFKSKGIQVLSSIMAPAGSIRVVAPKTHQSGMSMAVSLGFRKITAKDLPGKRPGRWTWLNATPASCVKFGLEYGYENRDPDLVICGINHGSNASMGANYSATLGGAEEGALNGCKAIGVSTADFRPDADFSQVEKYLPGLVKTLLSNWPDRFGIYYNINFPKAEIPIRGIRVARQGKGHWVKEFEHWNEEELRRRGLDHDFLWRSSGGDLEQGEEAYFMIGTFVDDETETETADHSLNAAGWITVTPCSVDLTDYGEYDRLKTLL